MGMSTGGSEDGGATPNINVTPLIDVLLVLLIIFMVISPAKPHQFEAKVPSEPKEDLNVEAKPNPLTLVVAVERDGKIKLNQESQGDISDTETITNRLQTIFKERENEGVVKEGTNEIEKTVFIKSPRSVKYGDVVKVIDAVKLADAQPIGLQIDDLDN